VRRLLSQDNQREDGRGVPRPEKKSYASVSGEEVGGSAQKKAMRGRIRGAAGGKGLKHPVRKKGKFVGTDGKK